MFMDDDKNAPTGFEEYYVDTPVTPDEFEEEKGLYHAYVFIDSDPRYLLMCDPGRGHSQSELRIPKATSICF